MEVIGLTTYQLVSSSETDTHTFSSDVVRRWCGGQKLMSVSVGIDGSGNLCRAVRQLSGGNFDRDMVVSLMNNTPRYGTCMESGARI